MKRTERKSAGGATLETVLTEVSQHSVEVSQNAKGEFTFACKLYFEEAGDVETVNAAFALYDRFVELKRARAGEVPAGKIVFKPVAEKED